MTDDEQVERVARAIAGSLMVTDYDQLVADGNGEIIHNAARAAIAAMQSNPIPIYASKDVTDEVLGKRGLVTTTASFPCKVHAVWTLNSFATDQEQREAEAAMARGDDAWMIEHGWTKATGEAADKPE